MEAKRVKQIIEDFNNNPEIKFIVINGFQFSKRDFIIKFEANCCVQLYTKSNMNPTLPMIFVHDILHINTDKDYYLTKEEILYDLNERINPGTLIKDLASQNILNLED